MVKVYQTLKWNLVTAVALLVMVVLYSRVVYTLWFKQNEGNQLTHQQIVSVGFEAIKTRAIRIFLCNPMKNLVTWNIFH